MAEATFLVDLSHVKGHPSCGWGAAHKNLALGAYMTVTRSAMHDTMHYDQYWFPSLPPATRRLLQTHRRVLPVRRHLHRPRQPAESAPAPRAMQPVRALPRGGARRAACASSRRTSWPSRKRTRSPSSCAWTRSRRETCLHQPGHADDSRLRLLRLHRSVRAARCRRIFGSDDIVAIDEATLDALARRCRYAGERAAVHGAA